MKLAIYTDGASRGNPGDASIGVVVKDDQGTVVATLSEFLGVATNNVAEYTALIRALETVHGETVRGETFRGLMPTEIAIYMDSQLVVRQMTGQYRVKSGHLMGLVERAKRLCQLFSECSIRFHHIPRAQNAEADALANAALDKRKRLRDNGPTESHR